jgi:hypothetical protein
MFPTNETPTTCFAPLTFSLFTTFVLVPYTATLLIAEDRGYSLEEAYEEMIRSADWGAATYQASDEDEQLNAILKGNVRKAREVVSKLCDYKTTDTYSIDQARRAAEVKAEPLELEGPAKMRRKVMPVRCPDLFLGFTNI